MPHVTSAAIETHRLGKRYGRLTAVDDLSIRIETGEIFGFLGPNGAGKTTTIRLLLGLLRPSAGSACLLGCDSTAHDVGWRRDVGYLPGELALWPAFSGEHTLDFLGALTGRPAAWRAELLDRLQLTTADLRRPVGSYSDGMKQKLGIAQALQCAPRLALLDEPTKGLDPLIQAAFYELLRDLPRRGTTVFFSSHVLPEVEHVCHRVAMLRRGRLVSAGAVDDVLRALPRRAVIVFADDVDPERLAPFGPAIFAGPRRIELHVEVRQVPALVTTLATLPVADVLIEPPTLEDVFLGQYQ